MRLREVRVETKRLLVLLERAACIAHTLERRGEVDPHACVAWIRVHREAEVLHRLGPVSGRRRIEATFAIELRRLHNPVQRREQRVRDRDLGHRPTARGTDSLLEVLCGLLELAEAAIRHPERIVDGRDLGVQGQGRRQVVHGAFVVALRESRPTQLDAHGRLAGIDRPRLGEALLGVQRPGQVEVDTSEPDQRREVGRAQEAGALETLGRPGQVAVVPENVSEVVGPAEISGRQTLGVSKGSAPPRR